jgi:hypothetical protein
MPSSLKLPGEFHDSCRPFYELLTSPPFELSLAARIPPKRQDIQTSPKTRLPDAPTPPSRGVYVFVGFFGSIAKVGRGNFARFTSDNYAWEYKGKPHPEAQRMAHIITTEHGGWIFEKAATDAETEERKIMELLMQRGHYLPGNKAGADVFRRTYNPTQGYRVDQ